MADNELDKFLTDAREAGLGVDDRPLGNVRARVTGDPGGTNVDVYEVSEDDGKVTVAHYGPNGQHLGTSNSTKDARKDLGLD